MQFALAPSSNRVKPGATRHGSRFSGFSALINASKQTADCEAVTATPFDRLMPLKK
jgi:hypothetical protein